MSWYVAYALSYRGIQEVMSERGVKVDHAAVQRWVVEYSQELMKPARKVMKSSTDSWGMEETYIKVNGEWVYLYRAVDKLGPTIDFMLSKKCDKPADKGFFLKPSVMPACLRRKPSITAALIWQASTPSIFHWRPWNAMHA